MELTSSQRAALLATARRSIETYLHDGGTDAEPPIIERELEKPGAAFVTLTLDGDLRGCIGYSEPLYPLHEAVARCAVTAASRDCRFAPITLQEFSGVTISISALSPIQKLDRMEQLEPGRHGLLIVGREHRGLLLPQVAAERGWDRETFLGETCRKAGLPTDAWKDEGVEAFVFEAQIFSEKGE